MPARTSGVQAQLDELQASVDEAVEILEGVNSVTSTREDLAQAVLDALESLSTEDSEDQD
jgi:hypothetical protein